MINLLFKHGHINWAILDQMMISGVNFLTGIILARYLGLEEFGIFTLVWMPLLFLNSYQMSMILSPMMSIGPKQNDEDNPVYYGTVLLQQIVFSCLSFLLLYSGIKISVLISPHWNIHDLALPVAVSALVFQLQDFLRRYFFTKQRPLLAFINDAISYLGQLALIVWLANTMELDTEIALWIIAATSALAVVFGIFFIENVKWDIKFTKKVIKHHWDFSKWLIASTFLHWGTANLFMIVAGGVLGVTAVGAMKAAYNLVGIVHILFLGLENIVPIRAAYILHNKGKKELVHYLTKIGLFATTATAILCGVIIIDPEFLIGFIYGKDFVGYGYLLYWCAGIYFVISLGLPLRNGLRTIEVTRPLFFSYFWSGIFTVLSAYPLAYYYELNGVMAGSLLSQIGIVAFVLISFKREMKI